MSHIIIENIPIDFSRKNVKNLNIRILPPDGKVKISAPYLMSASRIEKFVHERRDWILKAQQKTINKYKTGENLQYASNKEYKTGDEIYIWGEPYSLELLPSSRWKIEVNSSKHRAYLYATKNSDAKKRQQFLKKWYRNELLKEAEPVLQKWGKITGLKANNIVSRWTKSVWGTCDKQKSRIMLNAQLATKDPKYLNYVALHELAHLKYSNHGKRFKNFMTKYLPEWKEVRRELNG